MLARLDEGIAAARSAVNREGTLLRVETIEGEAQEILGTVIETVTKMGFVAEHIDHMSEDVARWYSASEIDEVSAEEARVLAERWAQELLDEGLLGQKMDDLRNALEDMLLYAFRQAAKTGIVHVDPADVLHQEMGGVGSADLELIREWLIRKLSGGQHSRSE